MKFISRIIAVALFILFFGFALKNTQDATLNFFFGTAIHASLVILLLAFFAAGAALGILAMTPTLFRHRRELIRQRRLLQEKQDEFNALQQARSQPPRPDAI